MKKGELLISALALAFIGLLFVMHHWNEHRREVPKPAIRVVMEKWHHYDHFWYPVAAFEGFGHDDGADGNLNLKYCEAAVSLWKLGAAEGLGREIYRCREQSSWSSFWQLSRDRNTPDEAITSRPD